MPLADDFLALAHGTATPAQWTAFGDALPPGGIDFLLPSLTNGDAIDLEVVRGFALAADASLTFYLDVCRALIGRKAARADLGTRVLLRCALRRPVSDDAAAPSLFAALCVHRAYRESAQQPALPDVGQQARARLDAARVRFGAQGPGAFVAPFHFYIVSAPTLAATDLSAWDEAAKSVLSAWEAGFRSGLLDILSDPSAPAALEWKGGDSEPLRVLQETLLAALASTPAGVMQQRLLAAIAAQLERCCQLWSRAFADWTPAPAAGAGFDASRAANAELRLHEAIEQLRGGPMAASAADAYHRWVALCGGFGAAATPADAAGTAWMRDWRAAEAESAALPLVEAVAPHALVRVVDRLRDPTLTASNDLRDAPHLTANVDYLMAIAGEVLVLGQHQGLMPLLRLDTAAPQEQSPPLPAAAPLLPLEARGRGVLDAALHPDHRRAIRAVLAELYAWRADIAYRRAGPKMLGAEFTPAQQPLLAAAQGFYGAAVGLLGGEAATNAWIVGIGLTGRVLDLRRDAVMNECHLRLAQLERGADYAGEQLSWPTTYAWDFLGDGPGGLDELLSLARTLDHAGAQLEFEQADIKEQLAERGAACEEAAHLVEASRDLASAEQQILEAVRAQMQAQEARVALAAQQRSAAEWHAKALQFARLAATDLAQADTVLQGAKKARLESLRKQVDVLQTQITSIKRELPSLREQLGKARDALAVVEQTAQEEHRRREAQRALISVVKAIVSVVSKYYTGVDLMKVADSAIGAFDAAKAGDWTTAAGDAFDAANTLSGGKLEKYVDQAKDVAGRYLSSLLPDGFDGAVKAIEDATGIRSDEALQRAIAAIGHQALRAGVSFLADQAHLQEVTARLGYGASNDELESLRSLVVSRAREAAYRAIERQGGQVLDEARRVLDCISQELEQKIGDRVFAAGERFEEQLVGFVAELRKKVPSADLAPVKAQLAALRGDLAQELAQRAGVALDEADRAIDEMASDVLGAQSALPPTPLPQAALDALADFRRKVDDARVKIAFLLKPDAPQEVANQLADASGDQFGAQLSKVMGQLRLGVSDAADHFDEANQDLAKVSNAFAQALSDQQQADFDAQVAKWRAQASKESSQASEALWKEAGESVLASGQQIAVEQQGKIELHHREQAQQDVLAARQAEADAAEARQRIAGLQLAREQARAARWEQLNQLPDPDRRRLRAEARIRLLDEGLQRLIQAWQMIIVYEVNLSAIPAAAAFAPDFCSLPEDAMRTTKDALGAVEAIWNASMLEGMRGFTTMDPKDFEGALTPEEQKRLLPILPSKPDQFFGSLELGGADDLARLSQGFTFALRPLESQRPAVLGPELPPLRAKGLYVELERVPRWNAEGAARLRLVGVMLRVLGGAAPAKYPVLYLVQESDGWLAARAADAWVGKQLGLPPTRATDELGIQLRDGTWVHRELETRPAFASYTVRISPASVQQIDYPNQFRAVVHFVAVGAPA